jgi:hypothetical protein
MPLLKYFLFLKHVKRPGTIFFPKYGHHAIVTTHFAYYLVTLGIPNEKSDAVLTHLFMLLRGACLLYLSRITLTCSIFLQYVHSNVHKIFQK